MSPLQLQNPTFDELTKYLKYKKYVATVGALLQKYDRSDVVPGATTGPRAVVARYTVLITEFEERYVTSGEVRDDEIGGDTESAGDQAVEKSGAGGGAAPTEVKAVEKGRRKATLAFAKTAQREQVEAALLEARWWRTALSWMRDVGVGSWEDRERLEQMHWTVEQLEARLAE